MKQHTLRLLDSAILETLEGRDMMSATPLGSVSFDNGILTLNAAPKHATDMTVNFYNNNSSELVARSGNAVDKVAASQVKEIVVNGSADSTSVSINPAIKAPAVINLNTGNAAVQAGTDDTVNVASGRTAIHLAGGGNTVHLGNGTDVIKASDKGDDTIYAGTGPAIINGAASKGTVIGATSKDKLVGTSNDTVTKASSTTTSGSTSTKTASTTTSSTSSTSSTTPTSSNTGSTSTTTATPTTAATSTQTATATATDATSPQPVITMVSGVQQTGLAVNVSGLTSTLGAGNILGATFTWNFGDTGGTHNTIIGQSAGHIYDTPGTYTITLTLTNANGETSIATQQVTIAASTRNVIYVDANGGSDSNNGSESAPYQTLAAAFANVGNNTEVLLKAGETYSVTSTININGSNVVVGSYGTGAAPVLSRVLGNGIGTFNTGTSANGITFQNITFDSPYGVPEGTSLPPKTGVSGIYVGGSNIAVRNCTFLTVDDCINENSNPTGVVVENNNVPSATDLRGYFVWGAGAQTTIMGNTVAGSVHEHDIRCYGWTQFTIEDNNLTNNDGKGCIEMQEGSYGYITDNTATGGEMRTGPLGEWGESTSDTTSWVVITNNVLNNTMMNFDPGSQHVLFDNNVINGDNQTAIDVQSSDAWVSEDLTISHNTGINNGTMGCFLLDNGNVNGIVLENNVWVAPNVIPGGWSTAAVQVMTDNLNDFTTIADNIWPDPSYMYSYANGGVNYVAPTTSNGDGYVPDSQWNSLSQVHNDQFLNVTQSDLVGTYQVTDGNVVAGSSMALQTAA